MSGNREGIGEATLGAFFNRFRLVAGIQAIEEDLRRHLTEHVTPSLTREQVFGDRLVDLEARAERDGVFGGSGDALLGFIDFSDGFKLLNTHRALLPRGLAEVVRALTPRFEAAVPIRNRVMHGRPYRSSDENDLVALMAALVDSDAPFPISREVLERLIANPEWSPTVTLEPDHGGACLHNLPVPEFDDTGLIGRDREVAEVIELLVGKRHTPVVTLTGEGGIGKTAVAVEVAYEIMDRYADFYSAILWTSAKTEWLTGTGVEVVVGAPTDFDSMVSEFADVYETGSSADDLMALLVDERVLLIVDNAESIHPDEILKLADTFVQASLLITSRVGLGQLERRVEIPPLSKKAAAVVLRKLAQKRGLPQWSSASEVQLVDVVTRLRQSPLAIRWFVEAVSAGGDPSVLLDNQQQLLHFCMSTIHDSLDTDAKAVIQALVACERECALAQLAAYTLIPRPRVQAAILELQRRAIVHFGPLREDHSQTYELAFTAAEYLSTFADEESLRLRSDVATRLRTIGEAEEQRKRLDNGDFKPKALIVTSPDEAAVAQILREALSVGREPELFRPLLESAIEALPSYFESYRVAAFLNSRTRPEESLRLYERAYGLAPAEHRPRVAYWMSGHLANELKDPSRGLELALEAHTALGRPETAERVGRMFLYQRDFSQAELFLLEAADGGDARTQAIAQTDLLDLEKRRAEWLSEERRPSEALARSLDGLERGFEFARLEVVDRKLEEALGALLAEALHAVTKIADLRLVDRDFLRLLELSRENSSLLLRGGMSSAEWWVRRLRYLSERVDLPDHWRLTIETLVAQTSVLEDEVHDGILRGEIVMFDKEKKFGFIRPRQDGENVFFHHTNLANPSFDGLFLLPNAPVSYSLQPTGDDGDGRLRALNVRLQLPESERAAGLKGRRLRVTTMQSGYGFASDFSTNGSVFIPPGVMGDRAVFEALIPGVEFECDIEFGDRGAIVAGGSVVVVQLPGD
jgi:cold shock CspA family protein